MKINPLSPNSDKYDAISPHNITTRDARTFGEQTESALPLLNLLELLKVNNVYRLQAIKFTHL